MILPSSLYDDLETRVPFLVLGKCQRCPGFELVVYPQGRPAVPDHPYVPCNWCGRVSVLFASPIVTAN